MESRPLPEKTEMAIRPENESRLWDEYPVDDTPMPEPPLGDDTNRHSTPYVIAVALVLMLLIAGVLAIGQSNGDRDVSQPETLPFIDEDSAATRLPSTPASPTTTLDADVRRPEDFGWEVTGEAYYSGCVPGSDTSLPDGVWFGYVTSIDEATIDFDLACFYGIEIIDGLESPFIENSNKTRRMLTLSPSVEVFTFSTGDGPVGPLDSADYSVGGWVDGLPDAVITIVDGQIVEIDHQAAAG